MNIRKTEERDLPEIMDIIELAKAYFRTQSIDQWQRGTPNEETIRNDIRNESSYVLEEDGKVIGTCCIRAFVDPNYALIEEGEWLNDEPYVVIHRIAIHPDAKGKSYGSAFFAFAEEMAKANGVQNVRVDTHPQNLSMQRLIAKNGFTKCGNVYVGEHELRYAYQKIMNERYDCMIK